MEDLQTIHDIEFASGDEDGAYEVEEQVESEDLDYDTDDVTDFVKRGTYFEEETSSAVFEGFSIEEREKKKYKSQKKGRVTIVQL